MPHPVIYRGDMAALVKEWQEKYRKAWSDRGEAGIRDLKIGNGECVRLPQELTSVGHTSRWQPGDRVVDVAKTLQPGTVIANFLFEYDKKWYPNSHGWHAALFVRGEGYSVVTGAPSQIVMFDQWRGRAPNLRHVRNWPSEIEKTKEPSNIADEFYVVVVP
ncbi:MAG TPA: BPSL0067 family protein [Telluria sp.]|nr:BPSL0067 family protein [Telluria sp.]